MVNAFFPFRFLGIILIWSSTIFLGISQTNTIEFIHLRDESSRISQLEVMDIIQDQFGFVWFATTKGLIRYDGHDMKTYRENPLDSFSLTDNFVRELIEDDSGNIWLGTGQGDLLRYDYLQDHFTLIEKDTNSALSKEVQDLLLDSKNRLWIATNFGLELVSQDLKSRRSYFDKDHHLYEYITNTLVEDPKGRIWLGTGGVGLHLLYPSDGKTISITDTIISGAANIGSTITKMFLSTDGKIWIADDTPRLHCLDLEKERITSYSFPHPNRPKFLHIWEIAETPKGNLWLGTREVGLIEFSPSDGSYNYHSFDPAHTISPASNLIGALLYTPDGLWIGYLGEGVDQLHNRRGGVTPLPTQRISEKQAAFNRVVEDTQGILWISTGGDGIFRLDPQNGDWTHFQHQPGNDQSLAHNLVWDLHVDQEGALWIATHNGLQRRDPQTGILRTYTGADGLQHKAIRSIWQDSRGTLWVGTFSGLHTLDLTTGQIQFIEAPFENPHFIVLDLFEDSRQHLWVSGFGLGVYRVNLQTGKSVHFQKKPDDARSISNNIVVSIAEDDEQQVWLGTQGGGLHLFVPHPTQSDSSYFMHWRTYNSNLADDNIWDIYAGGNHHLWLSTDAGLFAFNTKTHQSTSYQLQGIGRRFSIETKPNNSGTVYLRDYKGVYIFDPDSIARNLRKPPVFITNFHINGQEVLPQTKSVVTDNKLPILDQSIIFLSSLQLTHRQNDLIFEFSALNYVQPEKNRYKYKLVGYDEDWTETDALNRRIRYTNLSPGPYEFRVIGSNNDGIWNTTGKTLHIFIAPPWWQTWWAYCVYAVLLFLLIRSVYKFQLNRKIALNEAKRLKELDQTKNRLITNVTHEFRTPLTVILGMTDKIQEDPKNWLNEGIPAIQRNGKQVLNLVNQMLDLARLEAGSLSLSFEQSDVITYLSYLIQSYQSYANMQGIDLQIHKQIKTLNMDFSADALAKIINNLLTNAIKFTPAGGMVTVMLDQRNNHFYLEVSDSGEGIAPEHLPNVFDRFYQADSGSTRKGEGTGIGLALVKELVAHLNGKIEVNSTLGAGTTFQIKLPITHNAQKTTTSLPESRLQLIPKEIGPVGSSSDEDTNLPLLLLLEDNEDVARYTSSCLTNRYQVYWAKNGKEGVEQALDIIPDLIVCDVMMPGMNGYEVCGVLKTDERTSHIPIIMLTAKVDLDSRLKGLRQGADAYLAKPFHPEELDLRLENLLQASRKIKEHFERFPEAQESDFDFPQEHAFLVRVKSIIHAHLDDDKFGIPELCKELGLSRSQLHRKLKALTNKSTSLIIRSVRLQKAKELLLQTDEPIAQIAYQVGFENPSYFSVVFAEEFGMSPTEMREKNKTQQ